MSLPGEEGKENKEKQQPQRDVAERLTSVMKQERGRIEKVVTECETEIF